MDNIYKTLVETAELPYIIYNYKTNVLSCSRYLLQLINVSPYQEEITIDKIIAKISYSYRVRFNDFFNQFYNFQEKYEKDIIIEVELNPLLQDKKILKVKASPINIEALKNDEAPTYVSFVFEDITYKKFSLKYLQEKEYYQNIVQQFQVALVLLRHTNLENYSADAFIYYDCNPIFENILGVRKTEIIGKNITDILLDSSLDFVVNITQEIIKSGTVLEFNEDNIAIDKTFRVRAFFVANDTLAISLVETEEELRNSIEAHKELERKFNKSTEELELIVEKLEAEMIDREIREVELVTTTAELKQSLSRELKLSEIKSAFISMISHEYRTPITTIQTALFVLESMVLKQKYDKMPKYIAVIDSTLKSMLSLLENVLILDVEKEKIIINPTKHFIITICKSIVQDFIKQSDYNIKIEFVENSKDVAFTTDVTLLSIVIKAILDNACKFSPEDSTVTIEMKYIHNQNIFIMNIIDSGIGFPINETEHIFEPFTRCSNVGAIGGTGIGLAIAAKYASAINAEIKISNNQENGSTVSIILRELEESYEAI
ncbi:MAG: hypothetical protein GX372_07465 [Ignavibacteria bacterium]|jgi:signal transduction histidine kinase|nr:hypothetical protein [Ignavibacteria bacterium]